MSNRDDVKKDDAEENNSSSAADKKSPNGEIYSTKQKITHTVRQNPLAHMGENSVKLTFWEKVKRAFSTDDTYGAGFIDDEKDEDGLLGSDDIKGLFSEHIKIGKYGKKQEEKNNSTVTEAVKPAEEKKPEVFDSEDALEGGEFNFVAPEAAGDVIYTEEDAEAAEEELDYELAMNMLFTDAEAEQRRADKQKAEEAKKAAEEEAKTTEAVSSEEITEQSGEAQNKAAESAQAETVADSEKSAEQSGEAQAEVTGAAQTETSADNEKPTEQGGEAQAEVTEAAQQEAAANSGDKENTQTGAAAKRVSNAAALRVKGFFSKTKNKLVEMWNEKLPEADESAAGTKTETAKAAAVAETNVTAASDTKENTVSEATAAEQAQMLEELLPDEKQEQEKNPSAAITVIKNETIATTELDAEKVRAGLNVIDTKKQQEEFEIILEEPEILSKKPRSDEDTAEEPAEEQAESKSGDEGKTPQQLRQEQDNKKVLEKVKQAEEWIATQKKSPEDIAKKEKAYEKAFGEVKPLESISINDYVPPGRVNTIKVRAGRFTESVRSEYDFYIGYRTLKRAASNQSRIENVSKKINESVKSEEEKAAYGTDTSEEYTSSEDREKVNIAGHRSTAESKKPQRTEYSSEADKERVKKFILNDCSRSKRNFYITAVITAVMFIFFLFSGKFASNTTDAAGTGSGTERVFVLINLLLFAGALFISKDTLIDGLKPLRSFKSNADTSVALACAAVLIQSLAAFIVPTFFFRQSMILYTLPIMLPLTLNAWGKYMTACRAKENFKFVSGDFGKYTAKFYKNKKMWAQLLSGTSTENQEIVFQKRASFFKNFVKLTYEEDPGEKLSGRVAIPAAIFSVIVTIIYTCLAKSFLGALSVLSIMLCMSVPMCGRLLASFPLYHLSRSALKSQAMIVGYPAVEEFANTAAIMVDAKELYPEGTVHMNGIKTFGRHRIDEELIAAAAVMVHAGGAMAGMFDGIIEGDKEKKLPPVESMIYEDGKGLIGWVNKKRVLIGNRYLLEEHGIEPPPEDYEKNYRTNDNEITYLASSGELVAMFIISYNANRRVKEVMHRMEETGMCFLIRTVDSNITAERIAKDFGIYYKRVKILPTSQGNVLRDEMIGKDKTTPSHIATKGNIVSLGRAVSGCIKAKKNISLSLAIQVIEMLLGLLVVTMIVLFSGIQQIGAVMLFLFLLFWSAAVIVAPFIQKS